MVAATSSTVFDTNPYEGHSSLSDTEAEVLWQYARLSQNIRELIMDTQRLGEVPDTTLLKKLRVLEVKMGLVLTLFKASVWAVINEQPAIDGPGTYAETTADETIMQ